MSDSAARRPHAGSFAIGFVSALGFVSLGASLLIARAAFAQPSNAGANDVTITSQLQGLVVPQGGCAVVPSNAPREWFLINSDGTTLRTGIPLPAKP